MNKRLANILFFPPRYLRGEYIYKPMKEIATIEKLSHSELEQFVLRKILYTANYIYHHIPYYNSLFERNNIRPEDIKNIADWQKIPFLRKEDIKNNMGLLLNPIIKRIDKRSTSGSTGNPLIFYKDRYAAAYMDAVMYKSYSWHGIDIGEPQARFWGVPSFITMKLKAQLKDFLMNRKRMSAFELDFSSLEKFFNLLMKFKPTYFYGYPSLIYHFAKFVKNFTKPLDINLKAIIVTGELLQEKQKIYIQNVFNCPVLNEYGCTETGVVAFECRKNKLHVMSHNIYLEVIKDGIPVKDKDGEIYISELNSKTFNFIRYKLGDRGRFCSEGCDCGIPFPVIEITAGRIDDYILTKDGGKIYDAIFSYTLKKGVDSFRAVQKSYDLIEITIVKNNDYTSELENTYKKILKEKLSLDITFKYTNSLERELSGKLRYFICDIQK